MRYVGTTFSVIHGRECGSLAFLGLVDLRGSFPVGGWVISGEESLIGDGRDPKRERPRVITLIHREETVNLLGMAMSSYIDIDDAEAVLRAIRLTEPKKPIDLITHTPGGLVRPASQIAHSLRTREGKVTVFIPCYT